MVLVLRRCLRILSVRTALCLIPSLLWLVLIHAELRNCPVPGTIIRMTILFPLSISTFSSLYFQVNLVLLSSEARLAPIIPYMGSGLMIVIYLPPRCLLVAHVERDEIPYPYKVHDTTLHPLLNIAIKSTIVVRSRSRSCGGGDICGTTPA